MRRSVPSSRSRSMSFGDWRRVLAVILDGAFSVRPARRPAPRREAGGGSIVNIGGETGHRGAAGRGARRDGEGRARRHDESARRSTWRRSGSPSIASSRAASTPCAPAPPDPGRSTCIGPPCRRSGRLGTAGGGGCRWCACCADRTHATSPDRQSTSTAAGSCRDRDDEDAGPGQRDHRTRARAMQRRRHEQHRSTRRAEALGQSPPQSRTIPLRSPSPEAIARARRRIRTGPIKIIAPVQPGGGVDLVARTIADRLGQRARATDRRRQPERRRRRRRLAGHRARGARRLHADGRLRRHARHQSGGAQAALRCGQGFHADRDGRRHAERARRPAVAAGQHAARSSSRTRRANPGKLSYGSSGPGTLTHLAMEQLKVATDIDIVHVPYRGIGPAITDILGGQTQALFPGLAAALPHIKAGKMQPLAVTGAEAPSARCPTCRRSRSWATRASTACSGTASSARRTCRRADRQAPQRRDQQAARQSGVARAPVERGARADADVARRSSARYMRDDIARWTKTREGATD